MLSGYKIIDGDSHVFESQLLWQEYLEPRFRNFALTPAGTVNGEAIVRNYSERCHQESLKHIMQTHPQALANDFDAEFHVRAMMRMGIDISLVFPTLLGWIISNDQMDSDVAGAYVCAYNRWLYDYCSYNPTILRGVGVVNQHKPTEMIKDLKQVIQCGWKTVFLRPNPFKGRLLDDPVYEPFWLQCEELGISIALHEATHARLPAAGSDRFETRFALHACSHPMEHMMAFITLLQGGVLERHPQLKFGFIEAGCGWVPYWLWRLDREYEDLYWEVQEHVKIKPSEYFRRQCFVTFEPDEPYLSSVIEYLGEDNLIFGSDYPHVDHKTSVVSEAVSLENHISSITLRKLLWDNSVHFYGLE